MVAEYLCSETSTNTHTYTHTDLFVAHTAVVSRLTGLRSEQKGAAETGSATPVGVGLQDLARGCRAAREQQVLLNKAAPLLLVLTGIRLLLSLLSWPPPLSQMTDGVLWLWKL